VTRSEHTPPEIDYLAKDYASFRRLMLDHLSQLVPDWREQSPADLGHALVEVLAYAADYLSYYQDAAATEAYLGTARLRRSVRRHARLLEYYLQEGCNARAWVQIQVKDHEKDKDPEKGKLFLPVDTPLLTRLANYEEPVIGSDEAAYHQALDDGVPVFETMHHIYLMDHHNEIPILPRDKEHFLPKGSTAARLKYEWKPLASENLKIGDVLVLEELCEPQTGRADPDHRHAVRLTGITRQESVAGTWIDVEWAAADALPFDLCIAPYVPGRDSPSVARGNIVLVDHGRRITEELPVVRPGERYRPHLGRPDLTFAAPLNSQGARGEPACRAMEYQPYEAFAWVQLRQYAAQFAVRRKRSTRLLSSVDDKDRVTLPRVAADGEPMMMHYHWSLRRDLLNSGPFDRDFQVEMEEDRQAYLRFGFFNMGKLPEPGDRFVVTYRAGNGSRGNVGAETIFHVVHNKEDDEKEDREQLLKDLILCVRNPMPARGGCDPEDIESARLHAPYAYRSQKGCVTPADYAALAREHAGVVRATACSRWVGQGRRVVICVQRAGGKPVDEAFEQELSSDIEPYRLIGHEIEIRGPHYVPVRVQLGVYLVPGANEAGVYRQLLEALGDQSRPDGEEGFFYPDRFGFGQSIHQSQVIARAMAVPGVRRVEVKQFRRAGSDSDVNEITVESGEIARLDHLDLFLEGGA
jgi:Baseplate J-like protein